jgi:hypothetical protein
MLFNEVYSAYYNALAVLINKSIDGELNAKNASEFISTEAFRDSFVYIIDAIKSEEWQVITKDFKTPVKHYTEMPLTTLQKQFLKAISIDKRYTLFTDEKIEGLDDTEPLYSEKDFYYFDIINDGDPYESPEYIAVFRTVFKALKENRQLEIEFEGGKGSFHHSIYTPRKLEYSEKDDKFRLLCPERNKMTIINLARIKSCRLIDGYSIESKPLKRRKCRVTLEIIDERNALERCMLHFANYEKTTAQTEAKRYKMELTYYRDDETEVLIRVLSFGPLVKVISPESFIDQIKERLKRQKNLITAVPEK